MSDLKLGFIFMFSAIVGTVLFWIGLYIWFDVPITVAVDNAKAVLFNKPEQVLSTQDALDLGRLIEKNIIIEGNDVLGKISDFYTTIITLLITIITILGITIPLYIKTNSENVAKQQTKEEVKNYFSENISYHNHLETALHRSQPEIKKMLNGEIEELSSANEEQFNDIQTQLEQHGNALNDLQGGNNERVLQLISKVDMIEKYIQQLDPVEKEAAQGKVEGF